MKYWLMKSEPEVYSISDLKKEGTTAWHGIRNYQARNFMMNEMAPGDRVLFYHSNAEPAGVAGVAKVASQAKPDETQYQKKSEYFDTKSTQEKPIWFCVDIEYVSTFKNFVSLDSLRSNEQLKDMLVLKRGQRLSIQPVTEAEFETVLKLGN